MRKCDEWKTGFRTGYRLNEYLVMLCGLYNAISTFQTIFNVVLHILLDEGVVAYVDNILI